MDPSADREARSPTELQRCRDPDLFDDEGALWHAPETDDRVRAEPTAAGRA